MTTYDPSLEGSVLPSLPPVGTREADKIHAEVRQHMREMVTKLRHLQDMSIFPGQGNKYEELAFINSLVLLSQWAKPGIKNPNDLSRPPDHYHVKGYTGFLGRIQRANILLWVRQNDGEKVYFNFKSLKRDQIENIFGTADGRNLLLEDYQGKSMEGQAPIDIGEIGISFYSYSARSMRKQPVENIPRGDLLDVEVYRKHRGGFFA